MNNEKITHYAIDGHLLEMIRVSPNDYLLEHRPPSGPLQQVASIQLGQVSFSPLVDTFTTNGTVLLPPPASSKAQDPTTLFMDTLAFMERYVTWTQEFLVGAGAFVLSTWVYDRFEFMPALQFTGFPGTGKTRSLQVLRALCYHSAKISSPTSAVLHRIPSKYNVTLLIDEIDSKLAGDIRTILREGSSRDGCVVRCSPDTLEPQPFRCFGPKVYAGQHPIEDAALQSRIVTENMSTVRRAAHIGPTLPPQFEQESSELRARYLRWAMDTYFSLEPVIPSLPDTREQQVFIPLFTVTPQAFQGELFRLAERQGQATRRAAQETDDGEVVKALSDLGSPEVIRPKEVAAIVTRSRGLDPERDRHPDFFTPKKAAVALRRLGIEPAGRDEHGSIYWVSKEILERLYARYLP